MSLAPSLAPLRLHVPASLETELLDFVQRIYATQNANLAGGSPASLEDYHTQVRNLQHYFDELAAAGQQPSRPLVLADLSDALIAGCMKWLKDRGRAPETANKLRSSMVAIVNFLIEQDLPLRPCKVKKFKVPKRTPRAWLPDEVLRILTAARDFQGVDDVHTLDGTPAGRWFLALELFILNTGTRISAAMNTPTEGLDLEKGWVMIPADVQKHDSDEEFDLLPATVAALRAIQPGRYRRIFDAWPYDRRGRQWPTLNRWQRKILLAAGLPATKKDMFHKLRRSFATFIAAAGGMDLAREYCGHSHQSVTDRYVDPRVAGQRPRISELFKGLQLDVVQTPDRQKRLFE